MGKTNLYTKNRKNVSYNIFKQLNAVLVQTGIIVGSDVPDDSFEPSGVFVVSKDIGLKKWVVIYAPLRAVPGGTKLCDMPFGTLLDPKASEAPSATLPGRGPPFVPRERRCETAEPSAGVLREYPRRRQREIFNEMLCVKLCHLLSIHPKRVVSAGEAAEGDVRGLNCD